MVSGLDGFHRREENPDLENQRLFSGGDCPSWRTYSKVCVPADAGLYSGASEPDNIISRGIRFSAEKLNQQRKERNYQESIALWANRIRNTMVHERIQLFSLLIHEAGFIIHIQFPLFGFG